MTKRAFGELESQILGIFKSGGRKTVKQVHGLLGGKDNYNTVMTVMSRLAEKRQLGRERIGLQYEYWILPTASATSLLTTLKKTFFGVKTSVLMSHLIEVADDLSDAELAEMEEMIQKMRGKMQ